MKKFGIIILGLTLLCFCKKESEVNTPHYINITNNSSHSIIVQGYDGAPDFEIDSLETHAFSYETKGDNTRNKGFFEGYLDSTKLTYDSTINVYHGSTRYTVTRDIRQAKYYIYKNENGQPVHYYYYTLTNADFDEAVAIGDSL